MAIRLIAFDVDGSLTDGTIYMNAEGESVKGFSARDGLGLSLASRMGYIVGVITGRTSPIVMRRTEDLHLQFCQMKVSDKVSVMEDLLERFNVSWDEVAYFGDDWNDLALMKRAAVSGSPSDATDENKAVADFVSPHTAGYGAARDFIMEILKREGRYEEGLASFTEIGNTNPVSQ